MGWKRDKDIDCNKEGTSFICRKNHKKVIELPLSELRTDIPIRFKDYKIKLTNNENISSNTIDIKIFKKASEKRKSMCDVEVYHLQ